MAPNKRELRVLFGATLIVAVALVAWAVARDQPVLIAVAVGAVVASGCALVASSRPGQR